MSGKLFPLRRALTRCPAAQSSKKHKKHKHSKHSGDESDGGGDSGGDSDGGRVSAGNARELGQPVETDSANCSNRTLVCCVCHADELSFIDTSLIIPRKRRAAAIAADGCDTIVSDGSDADGDLKPKQAATVKADGESSSEAEF